MYTIYVIIEIRSTIDELNRILDTAKRISEPKDLQTYPECSTDAKEIEKF